MKCHLDKITVHYETRGKGRPLIMLHGYYDDRRIMIGCMEPILRNRRGWQRIYLDLPGMGETPGEEWIYNSDRMLEVVSNFIEAVIPNQQFVLAGYSYGGYLARGIIYHKRELVGGLLLLCPIIVADRDKRNLPQHVTLVKEYPLPSKLYPDETKNFESFAVVITRRTWERFLKEVFSGWKIADTKFLDRLRAHSSFSFDVDAFPGTFDKPTLILVGRQDRYVGYRGAWTILEKYPRATFAVLDQAGHELQIGQEHLFNALVKEWLDRVEESMKH